MFGTPKKIFTDNWGEFIVDTFHELDKRYNIKIQTTPSYNPWGNGLFESHNQTLTSILWKIKDDAKYEFDAALAWAVCAENSLFNSNGFCLSELVFIWIQIY